MDANRVLTQLLGSGAASGLAAGIAGGLLTSKKGRKIGMKALRVGGLAAIAGIAYSAWCRARDGGGAFASAPAAGPGDAVRPAPAFLPSPGDAATARDTGLLLLEAMIAAAHADSHLDGREQRAIFDRALRLALAPADKAELFDRLANPPSIESLALRARTPELALELYTASVLAIDADTPAEHLHLEALAKRLALPGDLVASVHAEVAGGPGSDGGAPLRRS